MLTRLPLIRNFGARPRPDAFAGSPRYRDGIFHNRRPTTAVEEFDRGSLARDFARKGDRGRPRGPIPLVRPDLPATAAEAAATWLGHASVLLEVGGRWVLADPVWSERVSPASRVGPRRHHPVPLGLTDLPEVDVVLISHDHYDHLDVATVEWLSRHQQVTFVVPLGIGAHLRHWGVAAHRIVELDWGQQVEIDGLTVTCTEAQHFSGRLFTRNTTLWSSWVVEAEGRRAFFGGDTGYTPAFKEIGETFGGFDLTVLPIGAYDRRWSDIHMDPTEALATHRDLRGDVLLPIHWATFDLAFHTWAAPIEWLTAASDGIAIATPRPGERLEVGRPLPTDRWWVPTEVG